MKNRKSLILSKLLKKHQVALICSSVVDTILMGRLLIDEAINPRVPYRKSLGIHEVQQLRCTNHRAINQLGKLLNFAAAELPLGTCLMQQRHSI